MCKTMLFKIKYSILDRSLDFESPLFPELAMSLSYCVKLYLPFFFKSTLSPIKWGKLSYHCHKEEQLSKWGMYEKIYVKFLVQYLVFNK